MMTEPTKPSRRLIRVMPPTTASLPAPGSAPQTEVAANGEAFPVNPEDRKKTDTAQIVAQPDTHRQRLGPLDKRSAGRADKGGLQLPGHISEAQAQLPCLGLVDVEDDLGCPFGDRRPGQRHGLFGSDQPAQPFAQHHHANNNVHERIDVVTEASLKNTLVLHGPDVDEPVSAHQNGRHHQDR